MIIIKLIAEVLVCENHDNEWMKQSVKNVRSGLFLNAKFCMHITYGLHNFILHNYKYIKANWLKWTLEQLKIAYVNAKLAGGPPKRR